MKRILNFKHWQLFLLIVILGAWTSPSPLKEIINSFAGLTFLLWIYSIAVFGQKRISELGLKQLDLRWFRINIIIIPILFILISLLSPEVESQDFHITDVVLIPTSLYLFFAIFQTIIVAIKTLTIVEKKKTVEFSDWIGNFILTLILIIGIWVIQPKVNKFIGSKN